MENKKLILASKSPSRSQLLGEAGIPFDIRTREVEETYPPELSAQEVPTFLAEKKAQALFDTLADDEVLLAADSIVVLGQTIFGKPKDYDDAVRILELLSGNVHQVITGVCLLSKDKKRTFSSSSDVHFGVLTAEEIEYYISNYKPFDKAGAYAIQKWIGLCKIDKIEGSYSNIVGLPVNQVYKELQQF